MARHSTPRFLDDRRPGDHQGRPRRGQDLVSHAIAFGLGLVGALGVLSIARGGVQDARDKAYDARSKVGRRGGESAVDPTDIPAKGWWDILRRTYAETNRDRVTAVAAGVTFYGLLALFPALTAFVSLYGLVTDPGSISDQLAGLDTVLPPDATGFLFDQISRISAGGSTSLSFALAISVGLAIWSANAGMKALFDALNVAYGEDEERGFFKLNLVSLCFTAGTLVFVLATLGAIAVLPIVLDTIYLGAASEWLISLGRWPLLFAVLILFLSLLYRFGPSRDHAQWKWVSPGALFAAIAWIIGSMLFSWYVANFEDYNKTYGAIGAVIGLLTWMWLSATILLVGAELNAETERQTDRDTTEGAPMPIGLRGADAADRKA